MGSITFKAESDSDSLSEDPNVIAYLQNLLYDNDIDRNALRFNMTVPKEMLYKWLLKSLIWSIQRKPTKTNSKEAMQKLERIPVHTKITSLNSKNLSILIARNQSFHIQHQWVLMKTFVCLSRKCLNTWGSECTVLCQMSISSKS